MTITVSKLDSKPKTKKRWRPQKRSFSANQLELELKHGVITSFKELDYYLSKGGQKFDSFVVFSTRGYGLNDLVFKNEGGLTKWQNAKKWLQEVKAWRG